MSLPEYNTERHRPKGKNCERTMQSRFYQDQVLTLISSWDVDTTRKKVLAQMVFLQCGLYVGPSQANFFFSTHMQPIYAYFLGCTCLQLAL